MADAEAIAQAIKKFIMNEFLPDEDPDELAYDTELITTGILDSVASLELVHFLQDRFGIRVQAHEADVDALNRICDMVQFVIRKRQSATG